MRDVGRGLPELPVDLEQVDVDLEVRFARHDDDAPRQVELLPLLFELVRAVVVEAHGVGDDAPFLSVACVT